SILRPHTVLLNSTRSPQRQRRFPANRIRQMPTTARRQHINPDLTRKNPRPELGPSYRSHLRQVISKVPLPSTIRNLPPQTRARPEIKRNTSLKHVQKIRLPKCGGV